METSARAILASALSAEVLLPPPISKEVEIIPKRVTPPGLASVGMSVLSAKGQLGGREEPIIVLRLDSGASISLIAEDFLKRMRHPPKVHTGLKITLAQLTDQSPRIRGYVHLPVRVKAADGTTLIFTAELYVVPGMTVEVLLGEDFQLSNELSVLRSVDSGTRVKVGDTGFMFEASSTDSLSEEQKRDIYRADGSLRAWEDTLIPAETTVRVPVAGDLQQGREWYVERFLVPTTDEAFLTVPNTLLGTSTIDAGYAEPGSIGRRSTLPVSNPTKVPRLLRAGTLLGYAKDRQTVLDHAQTAERYEQMEANARSLAVLI
ncbi:hypothetical protein AURDEDRAFT_65097, partial [Auricularia subglabra TFB-10046 SS5]